MPQRIRPFLAPVLILCAALTAAFLVWSGLVPNLLFTVRLDLGYLVLIPLGLIAALWVVFTLVSAHREQDSSDQALAAAAAEKRRFLSRLDHELKNPLTAIRAGLANLGETGLQEGQIQTLNSVEAQTLRLSRLSSDLRKLAELETRPLERSPIDTTEMLNEAVRLAQEQPGAVEREIKLTLPQAPWPLSTIQGDPDLLFLAVHNLLDNAIKFTRPGDTIEVRGFEDGSWLVVEVADTGLGIPADEVEHVGEELYRCQSARGIPGNGLGLALVYAIVNRHGGKACLRSREGKGTVVSLRLPSG